MLVMKRERVIWRKNPERAPVLPYCRTNSPLCRKPERAPVTTGSQENALQFSV